MKTNKEIRAEIVNAFKSKGWNNRKIGLSVDYSSIHATVKDISIPLKEVEDVLRSYESIDYDYASGEILCGANTFVFVRYDYKSLDDASVPFMEEAEKVFNESGCVIPVMERSGKRMVLIKDGACSYVEIDSEYGKRAAYDVKSLATAMALFNANGGLS